MDNTNGWASVWQRFEQPKQNWINSLTSMLDHINNAEVANRKNITAQQQNERINNSIDLNKESLQPKTSLELTNQYHNEARKAKLSAMITQYGMDNWVDITWTPDEIINTYLWWLSEQRRDYAWRRFSDYTHSAEFQEDSKEFAMEMWWREKTPIDYARDVIWWLWDFFEYWPNAAARANRRAWMKWGWLFKQEDQDALNVLNLAEEIYWINSTNFLRWMSEEEWNDLEWYIANNQEQLDKEWNAENIVLEWGLWGLMTAMLKHPVFNTLIWVWTQVPYVQDALAYLQEKSWDFGYYINQWPLLSDYREWLITEESKREFDEFTWQAIISAILELIFRTPWFFKKNKTSNVWWWGSWWGSNPIITPSEAKERFWLVINNVWENLISNFEKKKPSLQWEILANMNKMSDSAAMAFENKYWIKYWDFLNNKWAIWWFREVAVKLRENINRLYDLINKATERIKWDFQVKSDSMDLLVWDVMKYANDILEYETRPDVWSRLSAIASKYANWWKLSTEDVLYMLRYYERNNKMAYKESKVPKDVKRSTNIDSNVRRRLSGIAEENWFPEMKEINKEISMSRAILDELWKDIAKAYWDVSFTDVLMLLDPKQIPAFLAKEVLKSDWFKKNAVKFLNRAKWFKQDELLDVDFSKIDESNAEKYVSSKFNDAKWDWTQRLDYKWMEQATDNPDFTDLRDYDKPKPVKEVDMSKNNPWLQDKNIVERETVEVLDKIDPNRAIQTNIWDMTIDEWKAKIKDAQKQSKTSKKKGKRKK